MLNRQFGSVYLPALVPAPVLVVVLTELKLLHFIMEKDRIRHLCDLYLYLLDLDCRYSDNYLIHLLRLLFHPYLDLERACDHRRRLPYHHLCLLELDYTCHDSYHNRHLSCHDPNLSDLDSICQYNCQRYQVYCHDLDPEMIVVVPFTELQVAVQDILAQ
jgi:hypothetical protein